MAEEELRSARRSVSVSSRPEISTADTRTEKRIPAFSLRSSITLKSQEMAVGATPRLWVEHSRPIMVYVLPGEGVVNAMMSICEKKLCVCVCMCCGLTQVSVSKAEDAAICSVHHRLDDLCHRP